VTKTTGSFHIYFIILISRTCFGDLHSLVETIQNSHANHPAAYVEETMVFKTPKPFSKSKICKKLVKRRRWYSTLNVRRKNTHFQAQQRHCKTSLATALSNKLY